MVVAIISLDSFANLLPDSFNQHVPATQKTGGRTFPQLWDGARRKGTHSRTELSTDLRGNRRGANIKSCLQVGGGQGVVEKESDEELEERESVITESI